MSTEKWTTAIDQLTADFTSTFGHLTNAQLNVKPNDTTWSIAQNIDHLIVINKTYYPVLDAIRAGTYKTPFMAKIGFLVRYFGKAILKSVQPDRKKKMKTFSMWQPSASTIEGDILQQFSQHQEELKKLIVSSKDLIEKGTVISSPANKNIVYKLETAFDIIVAHEFRHFEQAKEVLSLPEMK